MKISDANIKCLKAAILKTFGRTLDSPTDFDNLSTQIQEKTGDIISPSTLKRLFGYIKSSTTPRPSTLSSLARYVGYTGWSDFCATQVPIGPSVAPINHAQKKKRAIYWIAGLVILGGALMVMLSGNSNLEMHSADANEVTVETDAQKYERILDQCITMTKIKCDSLRQFQSQMSALNYYQMINDEYFWLIFTYMKDSINTLTKEAFPSDSLLYDKYRTDIFSKCREIGAELLREATLPLAEQNKEKR